VVVGSGRAKLDPSGFYLRQELAIVSADTATGPYANALNNAAEGCGSDALANYAFNLDPNVPPLTNGNECSTVPNYDLTVSAYSSQGLLPTGATTTAVDLEHINGLPLIGYLNHTALHDPSAGSTEIVGAVSSRVRFLLQQPTGSSLFSHFPSVASVAPTLLEDTFSSQFDPVWLEHGTDCQPPHWVQPCPVTYTGIKVVPEKLVLEDSLPTPVYVYGQLDGQWVLAYSPVAFASDPKTNRYCPVALTSSNPEVVTFFDNVVTGVTTIVAAGVGTATIEVTVQGFTGSVFVPVTVQGVGD
jgi:hypothetical protein